MVYDLTVVEPTRVKDILTSPCVKDLAMALVTLKNQALKGMHMLTG